MLSSMFQGICLLKLISCSPSSAHPGIGKMFLGFWKSLELDVYSQALTVMLPESCQCALCYLCRFVCAVTVNFTFSSMLFKHTLGIVGEF